MPSAEKLIVSAVDVEANRFKARNLDVVGVIKEFSKAQLALMVRAAESDIKESRLMRLKARNEARQTERALREDKSVLERKNRKLAEHIQALQGYLDEANARADMLRLELAANVDTGNGETVRDRARRQQRAATARLVSQPERCQNHDDFALSVSLPYSRYLFGPSEAEMAELRKGPLPDPEAGFNAKLFDRVYRDMGQRTLQQAPLVLAVDTDPGGVGVQVLKDRYGIADRPGGDGQTLRSMLAKVLDRDLTPAERKEWQRRVVERTESMIAEHDGDGTS